MPRRQWRARLDEPGADTLARDHGGAKVDVTISLRQLWRECTGSTATTGLGLGHIMQDTIGTDYVTSFTMDDVEAMNQPTRPKQRSGRPTNMKPLLVKARDRFDFTVKENINRRGKKTGNTKVEFANSHDAVNDAVGTLLAIIYSLLSKYGYSKTDRPRFPFPVPFRIIAMDCEGGGNLRTRQFGFAEVRSKDIVGLKPLVWSTQFTGKSTTQTLPHAAHTDTCPSNFHHEQ